MPGTCRTGLAEGMPPNLGTPRGRLRNARGKARSGGFPGQKRQQLLHLGLRVARVVHLSRALNAARVRCRDLHLAAAW